MEPPALNPTKFSRIFKSAAVLALVASTTAGLTQPAPNVAPAAAQPAATNPNAQAANVLILLNVRGAKQAGLTITKSIDGGIKLAIEPRFANRTIDIGSRAMVQEIQNPGAPEGARQNFYAAKDPQLLDRLWSEAAGKIAALGIPIGQLQWDPAVAAIDGLPQQLELNTSDAFNLHPRIDLPLLQPLIARGELIVIGEVDASAVLAEISAAKAKAAEQKKQNDERTKSLLSRLPQYSESLVSFVLPAIKGNDDKPAQRRVCTIRSEGDFGEWSTGFRYLDKFGKGLRLPRTAQFDELAKDLDDLYTKVQTDKCQVLIINNEDAIKLSAAMQRDKIYFNVYLMIPKTELLASFAESRGYKSLEKYQFAKALTPAASAKQVDELETSGVVNLTDFNAAAERMEKAKYSTERAPAVVLQFLADESNGKAQKLSAIQVRDARDKRLAAEKKAREEEERAREAAFLKENPYIAVLSCGMPDHINILACFAGGSRGVDTELKLRNGASSNMYKAYNMSQAGREMRDGLHIDLKSSFDLVAQNSNETLILSLKIIDRATGKVVYQNQAAKFGVLRAASH